jgi:AraC-like DNA-binding protein
LESNRVPKITEYGQSARSVSGFHHHFKSVTAISPLQFQKQIRLQKALPLMVGGNMMLLVPALKSVMKNRHTSDGNIKNYLAFRRFTSQEILLLD